LIKIFVSYSRNDGGDFADFIKEYYEKDGHQFFDFYDKIGIDLDEIIRTLIAEVDIVIIIVTRSALKSSEVEKEVLEARKQNKTIIPCRYRGISWTELKWDLNKLQGFQFVDKHTLLRQLDEILFSENSAAIASSSEDDVVEKKASMTFVGVGLATMTARAAIHYIKKWNPFQIERYPYARFPDKVIIDDNIPLEVIIKSFRPISLTKKITSIKLKVDDKSQTEIPVQVIVECEDDGFEIVGRYYATINVPINMKDSHPVIFNVKPKKEGVHPIHIRFYQQTTYVGEITLEPLVTSLKNQEPINVSDSQIKEWKLNYSILENIIAGPDITLFIQEKVSSDFEYNVLIYSLDIPMEEMGPIKFQFNPATKFQKIFENIENLSYNTDIIDKKIKAQGISLYDELFPEKLKKLYWEKRDRIKSIRIISKEPWIPWEIIKPWRQLEDGNIEEDNFLCERFAFSRWLVGKNERIKNEVKKIKVIIPIDINVNDAVKQRNWIEEFAISKNIEISFDSSYDQVWNTLESEKEIDIIHFIGHGQNNTENPLLSVIELERKVPLNPQEIMGKKFGQSRPIVILNACQTGNQNFSLTGIQGWAPKFLEAGASVFIGTLWSVDTKTALDFIKEFYSQLASGISLGESVKNARNKCKKEGDTSWLAYQLYGHPNRTIKF
jgi:hypothetical protein